MCVYERGQRGSDKYNKPNGSMKCSCLQFLPATFTARLCVFTRLWEDIYYYITCVVCLFSKSWYGFYVFFLAFLLVQPAFYIDMWFWFDFWFECWFYFLITFVIEAKSKTLIKSTLPYCAKHSQTQFQNCTWVYGSSKETVVGLGVLL